MLEQPQLQQLEHLQQHMRQPTTAGAVVHRVQLLVLLQVAKCMQLRVGGRLASLTAGNRWVEAPPAAAATAAAAAAAAVSSAAGHLPSGPANKVFHLTLCKVTC
jgi:hypothetical protein